MRIIYTDENSRLKDFGKLIDSEEFKNFVDENITRTTEFNYISNFGKVDVKPYRCKPVLNEFFKKHSFQLGDKSEHANNLGNKNMSYVKDVNSGEYIGAIHLDNDFEDNVYCYATDINENPVSNVYTLTKTGIHLKTEKEIDWSKYSFEKEFEVLNLIDRAISLGILETGKNPDEIYVIKEDDGEEYTALITKKEAVKDLIENNQVHIVEETIKEAIEKEQSCSEEEILLKRIFEPDTGTIYISDNLQIYDLKLHEKGDMAGYITGMVETDGYGLELLFRVKDPENGHPMTLISIDYGYLHPEVSEQWNYITERLIEYAERYIEDNEPDMFYKTLLTQSDISAKEITKEDEFFIVELDINSPIREKLGFPANDNLDNYKVSVIYDETRDSVFLECLANEGFSDEKVFPYYPKDSEEKKNIYVAIHEFCYEKHNKSFDDIKKELNKKSQQENSLEDMIYVASEKTNSKHVAVQRKNKKEPVLS